MRVSLTVLAVLGGALAATAPQAEGPLAPLAQDELNALVADGQPMAAFERAFAMGDAMTQHDFSMAEGVGAQVGNGQMFTRVPRADLNAPGQWGQHVPERETGVNATNCLACHGVPIAMGAGNLAENILADPGHTGDPTKYLTRNPPALFALGIPQRLAEEISLELRAQHAAGEALACGAGAAQVALHAKGVSYGALSVTRTAADPCVVETDYTALDGIEPDLTIRPFGWKGTQSTLRVFARNALHNELGMQGIELVGDTDGDFDGVTGELSVGHITALTVFLAALPRPVSAIELADLGMVEMSRKERAAITAGETRFDDLGCAGCHVPSMVMNDTMFQEPSATPGYFDVMLPSGTQPDVVGLNTQTAIHFDLAGDQPDNRIWMGGRALFHLGALEIGDSGEAVARWYTDFKRHDMGAALADPDDPMGMGAQVFATRSLAGVGSTGPWLHDGRAMTLKQAILLHGGAAQEPRDAFEALSEAAQEEIVAFLESLQLYRAELP
ncbi:MAG: di-heme oxidoredictase family protein [Pseudomonadota bacterium]